MLRILPVLFGCLFISSLASAATPLTAPRNMPDLPGAAQKSVAATPADRAWLTIEEVTVVDHGTSMSWYAKTVNVGRRIAEDQLEIRGCQVLGNRILGDAGPAMTSGTAFSKGDVRTFARQNWLRMRDASQLKIVITDKRTNLSVAKVVSLPQPDNQAATQAGGPAAQIGDMSSEQFIDPQQKIVVEEAVYRGRGAYGVRLKNVGNRGIGAEQLTLRPFYHVRNRHAVVGTTATNRSGIPANGSKMVSSDGGGIYAFGMAECSSLEEVVIEIKNPLTGQILEQPFRSRDPRGRSSMSICISATSPIR